MQAVTQKRHLDDSVVGVAEKKRNLRKFVLESTCPGLFVKLLTTFQANEDCKVHIADDAFHLYCLQSMQSVAISITLQQDMFTVLETNDSSLHLIVNLQSLCQCLSKLQQWKPSALKIVGTEYMDIISTVEKKDRILTPSFKLYANDNTIQEVDSTWSYPVTMRMDSEELRNCLNCVNISDVKFFNFTICSNGIKLHAEGVNLAPVLPIPLDASTLEELKQHDLIGYHQKFLLANWSVVTKALKLDKYVYISIGEEHVPMKLQIQVHESTPNSSCICLYIVSLFSDEEEEYE